MHDDVEHFGLADHRIQDHGLLDVGRREALDQRLSEKRFEAFAEPGRREPGFDVPRAADDFQRLPVRHQHEAVRLDRPGDMDRLAVAERQVVCQAWLVALKHAGLRHAPRGGLARSLFCCGSLWQSRPICGAVAEALRGAAGRTSSPRKRDERAAVRRRSSDEHDRANRAHRPRGGAWRTRSQCSRAPTSSQWAGKPLRGEAVAS